MRRTRSLSGTWSFQLDPTGSLTAAEISPDREIPVPMPWQAAFPDLREYSGYAWYARSFDIGPEWLEGELLLHFGAVDYWCQVFVNGALAGEHEGGYTPFTLPIAGFVHEGDNRLAVRVYDVAQSEICISRWFHGRRTKDERRRNHEGRPTNDERQPMTPDDAADSVVGRRSSVVGSGPPFDPNDIPHGKQEWYTNVGGIWQDVSLIATSRAYVSAIRVTPDIHSGTVHAHVELEGVGVGADATLLRVAVFDGESRVEQTSRLEPGGKSYVAVLQVEQPHLWSPDDPHLYTVEASLVASLPVMGGGNQVMGDSLTPDTHHPSPEEDSLSNRFGFREIVTRDGQLLLNGEPLSCAARSTRTCTLTPSTQYPRRSSCATSSARVRSLD